MNDSESQPQKLQVNILKEALASLYSDIVFMNFSPFGLTLDFGQQLPAAKRIEIVSRVSMSPQHAKVLANALIENIKNYEKQFGEIKITDKMKKDIKDRKIGF